MNTIVITIEDKNSRCVEGNLGLKCLLIEFTVPKLSYIFYRYYNSLKLASKTGLMASK